MKIQVLQKVYHKLKILGKMENIYLQWSQGESQCVELYTAELPSDQSKEKM